MWFIRSLLRSVSLHAPGSDLGRGQRQAAARVPYPSSPEAVAALLPGLRVAGVEKMVEDYGKERWNKEKLAARFQKGQSSGSQEQGDAVLRGVWGVSKLQQAGASGELVPGFW